MLQQLKLILSHIYSQFISPLTKEHRVLFLYFPPPLTALLFFQRLNVVFEAAAAFIVSPPQRKKEAEWEERE